MGFSHWLSMLKRLSSVAGSLDYFDYDASPLNGFLVNIDGYAASSSKPPWASWSDWGWRALVASASDVAASGGRPAATVYSVGVESFDHALAIAAGVREASEWAGVIVLKADTNRSSGDSWIDVAVIGVSERPLSRKGARPGDLLVQIGYIGYGFVADKALKGLIDLNMYPETLGYTRRPKPPLNMGLVISKCGARAAIDNSDGWASTLYQLSEASGVKVVVEDVLAAREALELAASISAVEEDLVESWEDYNLAVAAGAEESECILRECRKAGVPCAIVGRLEHGAGVYFKSRRLEPSGWAWF